MIELVTSILILGGALWILTAAIGAVRLPDVLCRSHAVAKALTLGIALMLLGGWLHLGADVAGTKVVLVIFFLIITIPVASHLVALLAFRQKIPRWRERPIEDHRREGK
jgi:multicomponent Na+:H+ antiporter subunit G